MSIDVADAIKISTDRIQEFLDEDTIEIRDDQNNVLWKYVEQVPQNQNLVFETRPNRSFTNPVAYSSFPTYYVDVNKKNTFYKYMSYTGEMDASSEGIWFDGLNIYFGHWKLDRTNNTWIKQNWNNISPTNVVNSRYMFVYDDQIYMVGSQWQNGYKFDRSTNTWSIQTKFTGIEGYDVWTDGSTLFYGHGNTQQRYDSENNTWVDIIWYDDNYRQVTFNGQDVIKINDVYYIKSGSYVYSWTGSGLLTRLQDSIYDWPTYFNQIWTDGTDTYYSYDLGNSNKEVKKWDATQSKFITQSWGSIPAQGARVWSYGMHAKDNHCKPIFKSNLEF